MTPDDLKRSAAERAVALVRSGMGLGLGTGSTAAHFVDLLGAQGARRARCRRRPDLASARAVRRRAWAFRMSTLDAPPGLDLTVDGADEFDGRLRLIKGGGGALLREKIVAAASARMVVIADASKRVETLGRFPLPVEVVTVRARGDAAPRRAGRAPTRRLHAARSRCARERTAALRHRRRPPHPRLRASARIPDPETLAAPSRRHPGRRRARAVHRAGAGGRRGGCRGRRGSSATSAEPACRQGDSGRCRSLRPCPSGRAPLEPRGRCAACARCRRSRLPAAAPATGAAGPDAPPQLAAARDVVLASGISRSFAIIVPQIMRADPADLTQHAARARQRPRRGARQLRPEFQARRAR